MGSEPVEELPDDLEAWVAERAATDGTTRAEVVRRLMAAHRLLDQQPDDLEDALPEALTAPADETVDPDELDRLDDRIEALDGRVGGLEADLDEKITDVRERVIQVKRETDAKAPADHAHPDFERRLNDGFENYEEVLEYLTDRTDDLAEDAAERGSKLRTVANAVVDLRKRVAEIEGVVERRAAVTELRESANRQGITEAACGSCGESVRLGLLDEPACPHCGSPFDGVEPGGWFRSPRLTVGQLPALEAGRPPDGDGTDRTQADTGSEQAGENEGDGRAGTHDAADDRGTQDAPSSEDGANSDGAAGATDNSGGTSEADRSDRTTGPEDADGTSEQGNGGFEFGGDFPGDASDTDAGMSRSDGGADGR
jgi:prefoldin subunit 5